MEIPSLTTADICQKIIDDWHSLDQFTLETSGSTGSPKTIYHSKEALIWSANATRTAWLKHTNLCQICVLPLHKAGGFMQVIRALVWNQPLWVFMPSATPFQNIHFPFTIKADSLVLIVDNKIHHFKSDKDLLNHWHKYYPCISSLTPMQLANILVNPTATDFLKTLDTVLIGGQALDPSLSEKVLRIAPNTQFIETFGSTETASHFAGRNISAADPYFYLIQNTKIRTNNNQEIQISNPSTQSAPNGWITLQDKVKIINQQSFQWQNRTNLMVNSGGIKIEIEPLEFAISQLLNLPRHCLAVTGCPDPILGEKLTLFIAFSADEGPTNIGLNLDQMAKKLQSLPKHQIPKEIRIIKKIPLTNNGKTDRSALCQNQPIENIL